MKSDELDQLNVAIQELQINEGVVIEPVALSDYQARNLPISSKDSMLVSQFASHLPSILATDKLSNAYSLTFPDGIEHTLMRLKQGGVSTTFINDETKKIAGVASLYKLETSAAILNTFTIMSLASGQFFLSQINKDLNLINQQVNEILKFLYGDKKAELLSEISFTRYAFDNYMSIMRHEKQHLATLINLQNSRKIAMQDIEFYINDLEHKASDDSNTSPADMEQIKDSLDLSLQLYISSFILERYYANNTDEVFLSYLETSIADYLDNCKTREISAFQNAYNRLTNKDGKAIALFGKDSRATEKNRIERIITELKSKKITEHQAYIKDSIEIHEQSKTFLIAKDGKVYIV